MWLDCLIVTYPPTWNTVAFFSHNGTPNISENLPDHECPSFTILLMPKLTRAIKQLSGVLRLANIGENNNGQNWGTCWRPFLVTNCDVRSGTAVEDQSLTRFQATYFEGGGAAATNTTIKRKNTENKRLILVFSFFLVSNSFLLVLIHIILFFCWFFLRSWLQWRQLQWASKRITAVEDRASGPPGSQRQWRSLRPRMQFWTPPEKSSTHILWHTRDGIKVGSKLLAE